MTSISSSRFTIRGAAFGQSDTVDSFTTADEGLALTWAIDRARMYDVRQVTLVAAGDDPDVQAVRNWTESGDSGWRAWRDGDWRGGCALDDLFGVD